ncbi:MAG: hypothetical protein RBT68_10170 [Spirochaetia bacterium]|jgi:hypothetical protein|nr:hypothetical protein [Spirochaetia bacterium]
MMKPIRRFFGFALYLFIGLPLLLGSMTMLSVRPWLAEPAAYKALVEDQRFTAVLEAPQLPEHMPPTLDLGGYRYDGPAAAAAFQAAIPASALVQTASRSVDTVFSAIDSGASGFMLDLQPLREALIAGSGPFAATYLAEAGGAPAAIPDQQAGRKLVPATGRQALPSSGQVPSGQASTGQWPTLTESNLANALKAMATDLPPTLAVDDPSLGVAGQRTANLATMRQEFSSAGIWLALAAAGLTVAGVFIAEENWKKRLKLLGSRILGPGIPILVIGLVPHLINPAGLIRMAGAASMNQFPALLEYIKFAATSLTGGFMVVGLAAVGLGTVLVSTTYLIPPGDDDELEELP